MNLREIRLSNAKDGIVRHFFESCDSKTQFSTMLPVSALNPAGFNPAIRTTSTALLQLKANIQEDGEILQELHVMYKPPRLLYVIADGHRRWEIARQLGFDKVRCRVHTEGSLEELWIRLNRYTRKISAYEWMCAWIESGKRVQPSGSILTNIKLALEIFGSEDAMRTWLIDTKTSPNIVNTIAEVHGALDFESLKPLPTKRKIGEWLIRLKQQDHVRTKIGECERTEKNKRAAKELSVAKYIKRRIENDLPIFDEES